MKFWKFLWQLCIATVVVLGVMAGAVAAILISAKFGDAGLFVFAFLVSIIVNLSGVAFNR